MGDVQGGIVPGNKQHVVKTNIRRVPLCEIPLEGGKSGILKLA